MQESDIKRMAGVRTVAQCPACGRTVRLDLSHNPQTESLRQIMEALGMDASRDISYHGSVSCECGKRVAVTFVVSALDEELSDE